MSVKKKIDLGELYVTWDRLSCSGFWIYTCWSTTRAGPVGVVWGWVSNVAFHVFYSYTLPGLRRCGVRAEIQKALLKHYKVISTDSGTKEGLSFMKKSGYVKTPMGWYCERKAKK